MEEVRQETAEAVEGEVVDTAAVIPSGKIEFRLIDPTEDGFLRVIQWNKEELEEGVRQKIAAYENIVYNDDNIKQAKADRAELNKLIRAIEERRKKVKGIITAPYTAFEAEVREVLGLIKKPVGMIDKQVRAFEDGKKEEKKKGIKTAYEEAVGDLAGVLPFERVFEARYLNQTYKLSTAQADIKRKIEKVRADLDTIDSLGSEYRLNAKDVYIKTFDLSAALAEDKRLHDLEQKLEEEKKRKAEEEAERERLQEERKKAEDEKRRAAETEKSRYGEAQRTGAYVGTAGTLPQTMIGKTDAPIERSASNHASAKEVDTETSEDVPGTAGVAAASPENVSRPAENVSRPAENVSRTAETVSGCGGKEEGPDENVATSPPSDMYVPDPFLPQKDTKQYKASFTVYGTRAQIMALKQYMVDNNIRFGKVER